MRLVRATLLAGMVAMTACASERALEDELEKRELSACPNSPNCVSTLAEEGARAMKPLLFRIPGRDAQARVRRVIEAMPRTKIVCDEPGYLRAEFTSRIFRFVDDVVILIDDESKRIDFRSASRIGYYDFGANRKRMEAICRSLTSHEEGIFIGTEG